MAYSTIPKKKCKCGTKEDPCKLYPSSGYEGFYYLHAPERVKEKAEAKTRKQKKAARQRLQNKVLALKPEDNDSKLDLWFRLQMQANDKYCQNCGKSLYHYNDNDWRGSQHHIVDKSPLNGCPSVATNPLNHLVLGKWCCHSQWHTSFINASKMPVFDKAQEKFLLFQRFIAPEELKKVNPYLFQLDAAANPSGPVNNNQKQND